MSVDDEECFGQPSTVTTTENVAKVRDAILEERRRMSHDVWNIVGLSYGMCQRTLSNELNMRRTAAKFVPRLLSSDQKEYCISVCTEIEEQAEKTLTLSPTSLLVTNLGCLGTTLRLSSSCLIGKTPTSPRPKKARHVWNNVNSMLIIFFENEGIVHKEFVPKGQMVNGKLYCDVLRRMRENIQCKHPDKWRNNSWVLHHDKALAHASLIVRQSLASTNTSHPPLSLLTGPRPL